MMDRPFDERLARDLVIGIAHDARALGEARAHAAEAERGLQRDVLAFLSLVEGEDATVRVRSRGVSKAEAAKIEAAGALANQAIESGDFGPLLTAVRALAGRKPTAGR